MKKLFMLLTVQGIVFLSACAQKQEKETATAAETETAVETIQAEQGTEIGMRYIDISLPGTDGATVSVSDYVGKNKYTLIDFWASWCPPCRAEMPNIVSAYAEYHDKGLEVVGVSLDNKKEAWTAAITALQMPWPQMSDLKGWDCEGAALYGVRSIPANVLVDQQGIIVAKNLRAEGLQQKLAELLK